MPKSKKFVLIICEGPTDENALYRIMKGFFIRIDMTYMMFLGEGSSLLFISRGNAIEISFRILNS